MDRERNYKCNKLRVMLGVFHSESTRLSFYRKYGRKSLTRIKQAMRGEEQSMKNCVVLMADVAWLLAEFHFTEKTRELCTVDEPDWSTKLVNGGCHHQVSEFADLHQIYLCLPL